MSTYDHEEQEQIAALKAWWRERGTLVLLAVTLVAGGFAAWSGWQWYQRSRTVEASLVYVELQRVAGTGDLKKVRDAAGTILESYPRSVYAPLAALISAKAHFEGNDAKTARVQLQWAADNARDVELQAIARLRLAALLIDEKGYDEALKTLDGKHEPAFAARFAEVRGDAQAAKGSKAEARAAYKAALEAADPQDSGARDLLQLKLDSLGEL